jgi:restriction system protein
MAERPELPTYLDLILPTLRAVENLGGSAQAREITPRVLTEIDATDEQLELRYENRPKSVLVDRVDWARSYAFLGGVLERPRRGLFTISPSGRELLALPEEEAVERIRVMDREVRNARRRERSTRVHVPPEDEAADAISDVAEESAWQEALLTRLHKLTPEGFEEFVIYLLKSYGMELTRVGGSGDEGIDGIGLAPISPVLYSRVAVQAKKYDPGSSLGREVVALFQRDAAAAGAERAVLVTLGRFSPAARKAATAATPTVNLIDGDRLCELVQEQEIGVRVVPRVAERWFDRFDSVHQHG